MPWVDDDLWEALQQVIATTGKAKGKSQGKAKGGWGGKSGYGGGSPIQTMGAVGGGGWGKDGGRGNDAGWSKGKGKKGKSAVAKRAEAQVGFATQPKKAKEQPVHMAWKSRLQQAYSQELHLTPTKESLVYTMIEEGEDGYVCSLTCDRFDNVYAGDELQPTKKLAEEAAAMAALQSEFPHVYAAVPAQTRNAGASAFAEEVVGEKRKWAPGSGGSSGGTDPKSRLNTSLMMLCERPVTKADVVYTLYETGEDVTAVVKLNCLEGEPEHMGRPAVGTGKDAKKLAECNAAEVALEAYKEAIEEKIPEHEARKVQKKAEREAAFSAKIEAMKAEEAEAEQEQVTGSVKPVGIVKSSGMKPAAKPTIRKTGFGM